ncbi:MAG: hypothetical protein ACK4OM_06475 [Alphaproteobacteria bacterium]
MSKIKSLLINNISPAIKLEPVLSDFIPYACHYDPETILTKAGEFLQVIKIVGFTYEVLEQDIDLRTTLRNAITQNVKNPNFSFWIHTVRRKRNLDPGGVFPYYFAEETHEAWCRKNYWHDKYVNELYVTIVYRNLEFSISNFKQFLYSFSYYHQKKHYEKEFEKLHSDLNDLTNNILDSLSKYGAQKLTIVEDEEGPYSEQLEFFGKIIHLSDNRMPMPLVNLSKYLSSHKMAFGNTSFEIKGDEEKKFGAILSVKEYHELSLKELDKFLQLPQEMVISQSVNFTNSKKIFKKFNYQNYILNVSGDTEFAKLSGLEEVLNGDNGLTDFGNSQSTIMLIDKTLAGLEEQVSRSVKILSNLGMMIIREDLNLENCFWSQLPANFKFLVRNSPIDPKFAGGFASLNNFPAGRLNNKWGKAITLFRTAIGTPYFFNLHLNNIGHTGVIGPLASGKTTLINFILSEACKYDPNIFILDYNQRSELLVNALGGVYNLPESIKFNPFSIEASDANINFLTEWLMRVLYGKEIVAENIKNYCDKLIKDVMGLPDNQRNISSLARLINDIEENNVKEELRLRIENWHGEGKFAKIFSNDLAKLEIKKITSFEITYFLEDECLKFAVISYLINQFNNSLDGKPTIILLQNSDLIIDEDKFEEWLDFLTAKNAIALISIEEPLKQKNLITKILEKAATQIFLPHSEKHEEYKKLYDFDDHEFQLFKSLKYINRHFLLKQNKDTIIAELNLSGLDETLSILTGEKKYKDALINAKKEKGDNPESWLPMFYEKTKK